MRRPDLMLVREALEGLVTPTVATALVFEALEEAGGMPEDLEAMQAFARGPLDRAARKRLNDTQASELALHLDALFARVPREGLVLDVEVEDSDGAATAEVLVVHEPVPVVVFGAGAALCVRLVASLGPDRVQASLVTDAAALAHAAFAKSPLFVVIDGSETTVSDAGELADALARLPDATTTVLWGAETPGARALFTFAQQRGVTPVALRLDEGIEPFLDLVLSRFSTA